MDALRLLIHAPGAPGLRLLGLGPGLRPSRGLWKLQRLLDQHTFWAKGRSLGQLRRMLAGSAAVASLWRGKRLVGFARASSDGVFRAVLWDVVIPEDLQGQGLGRQLVEALLNSEAVANVERVYLMTTNSAGFYQQLGFSLVNGQQLLRRDHQNSDDLERW
jgi:ribosomal protein S18 acetylase RimI-like enzyme